MGDKVSNISFSSLCPTQNTHGLNAKSENSDENKAKGSNFVNCIFTTTTAAYNG